MSGKNLERIQSRLAPGAGWKHLFVAVAYGSVYELLREISLSHWNLPTGLRVLCLLLVPYRFWPAMIVAEAIPLAYQGWLHHGELGSLWACVLTIPPLLLTAPLVALLKRHVPLFRDGEPQIPAMLTYVLIGACVNALANAWALSTVRMPAGEMAPAVTTHIVLLYFLGCYLGALTLVPAFLALWKPVSSGPRPFRFAVSGALLRDVSLGAAPPLWLLVLLATRSHNADVVEIARLAAFLPVAWMALRHGWRGAAIAGMLASVAVELTVTGVREPAVIQAQALVAFALSTLLMLGGRLQMAPRRGDAPVHDPGEALLGFRLAQQGLYQEEQRLRHVAESLDRLGDNLREGQARMMTRLRPVMPANIEQLYARHLDITQREVQRLADALHPRSWRERGLAATFEDGPLAQAAALAGAGYRCEFSGDGLNLLAPDVHMMLYRQACEVFVHLLAKEPLRHVRVQIRGGSTHGRRWVVLRIMASRVAHMQRGKPVPEWRQVVSLLGTNGQGMATVRERAQIYGGTVHQREDDGRLGVTLLLHDALRIESLEPSMGYARPLPA